MANQEDSDSEVNFNINHPGGGEDDYRGEDGDHNYVSPERRYRQSSHNIKPDPFTGEEDWEQYISYFEDCADLAQWSEKEKLLYLATSLKHQARLHYSSLPAHEKRSYRLLSTRLEQRFGSTRQTTRWLSKIQNRTRGKNESVATFGDEIRLYAQKAYVSLGSEAQEMLALEHFYKSFSPEMRCRLMDNGCRTIREAVEIVERYEDVLGRSKTTFEASRVRGIAVHGNLSSSDLKDNRDLDALRDTIKRIEQRLDKLETSARKGDKACYTCGSSDHLYRNCPNKDKPKRKTSKNQENAKPSTQ